MKYLLILSLLLCGCFSTTPKYKVGDCISFVYDEKEFEPRHLSELIYNILKVGKESYYTQFYTNKYTTIFFKQQDFFVLVDCNSGKEL